MKSRYLLSLAIVAVALLVACSKKGDGAPAQSVRVSATKAYETYFGPAPTTDKGTCYAFVIYFPSAKDPAKVIPFPFFTFDEGTLKKVALQRLLGGMTDLKAYQGEILQPFPQGTRLLGVTETGVTVTVNFSSDLLSSAHDETKERALVNAVVLTLRQLSGVKNVVIQVDGKESRLSKAARSVDESVIQQPSQPRLLSVTAMKEKGAKNVDEVDAFFDRPVDIKVLQISGADGKPFPGDVYHSVFDMAAVLKPKDAAAFQPGMQVKVRWNVVDKLGRASEGEGDMALEVKEH